MARPTEFNFGGVRSGLN